MRISTVRYERLFSLEGYNNERICFEASLDEKDDPNVAIGSLFFRVLKVEEVLEEYREQLKHFKWNETAIRDIEHRIADIAAHIPRLEVEIEKIKSSPDGYADCSYQLGQLKRLKAEQPQKDEELKKLLKQRDEYMKNLEGLGAKIKKGKF